MSGIHWDGPAGRILEAWLDEAFELVTSDECLEELVRVLREFKRPMPEQEIAAWASFFRTAKVESSAKVTACRDPDDDKFLEAALAGEAGFIITHDKLLLELDPWRGISILTPPAFLEVLRNKCTEGGCEGW